MAKELPKRSEVKEEFTWKLEDMYPSLDAWEADVKKARDLGCHGRSGYRQRRKFIYRP